MNNQAPWNDVINYLNESKNTYLFGGFFAFLIIILLTYLSTIVMGIAIHPTLFSLAMTIFYTTSSMAAKDKKQEFTLIREGLCYLIATILCMILIGSPFNTQNMPADSTIQQETITTE